MWHHPKYYEELRKKRKELEASLDPESEDQASSTKQQAINETVPHNDIEEAATNCRSDDMSQDK